MGMIGRYCRLDEKTLKAVLAEEQDAEDLLFGQSDDDEELRLDLDKAWHAIHFTLTGNMFDADEDDPLGFVVLGGTPLSFTEGEFVPTYLTADQVSAAAAMLEELTEDWFRTRFDLEEMQKNSIYPVQDDEEEDEFFDYVWTHFEGLKEFFKCAGSENQCILFCVC